jgi:glycosyltransferase involved in cell wall biosynthesis
MTSEAVSPPLRVLIVAEHASAKFGGEAALALHYFRVLRRRGLPVWLVTHARTRDELARLFPDERRIHYIEDTWLHILVWRLSTRLPAQIAYFTTGFIGRIAVQLAQRRIVRRLVASEGIDVVHQPMPVSPREPSLMFGFGVPVVIGPMNGGMDYPPGFRHGHGRGRVEKLLLTLGRMSSATMNWLIPGKRRAAALLVANRRTRDALPSGVSRRVIELVENGVDLTLWRPQTSAPADGSADRDGVVCFAFLGRLVDWKAVDLLLLAFQRASQRAPMRLLVIGDGLERPALEALAGQLGIVAPEEGAPGVRFAGWLSQPEAAERLQASDALVLSSLLECGGAVVLEAMAMGKPVIATAWGGPVDYLDADCGILVPPTDRDALVAGLADAMVELALSPGRRAELGRHGRQKVHDEYDWEIKVDRVLDIYRDAMKPAPVGADWAPT